MGLTWQELVDMEPYTTIKDWREDHIRCLIIRSAASLCAYVGIPISHPMVREVELEEYFVFGELRRRWNYDKFNIDCHGGITFGQYGDGEMFPKEYFWLGWDYAHAGDDCFYYYQPPLSKMRFTFQFYFQNKQWLVEDVEEEVKDAVKELKKLMKKSTKTVLN